MATFVGRWFFESVDKFNYASARMETEFGLADWSNNGWSKSGSLDISIYDNIKDYDKALEILNSANGVKS